MSSTFLAVDQAADRLRLHPKTVRRFIREGRLRATRIGKSYRILESDLVRFAGGAAEIPSASTARVTSVVDVENVDAGTAQRAARLLPGMLNSREASPDPISLNVLYDPERRQLKVLLAGSPSRVAGILAHVEFVLGAEDLR